MSDYEVTLVNDNSTFEKACSILYALLTTLIVFVNPFDYIQHIASINTLLIHPQAGVLCPFQGP